MKKLLIPHYLYLTFTIIIYCLPARAQNIKLVFTPMVDGNVWQPNTTYTNPHGENFELRYFKFYLHNLEFISNVTTHSTVRQQADKYYLIDAADSNSCNIDVSEPPEHFFAVKFTLGVDSIDNVSGAQAGVLDPMNGMYWTWNSGYVMAKLEGTSPASPLPNHKFEYHVGGFANANNVQQNIILLLPKTVDVASKKKIVINISVNINEWFKTPAAITIAQTPACTTPGLLAKKIAANYADMFTITAISQ
jgi:hypothetical protein